MVELSPVRAWHANPALADPNELVCPVYDTLSEAELARYARHPHNAAGFVPRPRTLPLDAFVPRAAAQLVTAIGAGAYVQDPEPALYAYGIQYTPPDDIRETIEPRDRRKQYLLLGLVGTLDLARQPEGSIALHERTFDDRVEERVALTEATGRTFAPIMAGYHFNDHRVNDLLESLLGLDRRLMSFSGSVPPVASAQLDGTVHRLWRIDAPDAIRQLTELVRPARLLILDGHHRFTAARRRYERGAASAPLTMLVDGSDRALQLLPWHRVLPASTLPFAHLIDRARVDFPDVTPVAGPVTTELLVARLRDMHFGRRRGFLALHDAELFEVSGPPADDDAGADFDLLHAFLEERLGIDAGQLLFVRSPGRLREHLRNRGDPGEGGVGLLLPPLSTRGVEERAFGRGQVMAHKSTMFLPKVAEGLLFAPAGGV